MTLIAGTFNSRDLGGLPLRSGGSTRAGALFRSDALATATPAGLATVAESSIGTVVDFRTPPERAEAPNRLPPSRTVRTIELPLLEGALTGAAGPGNASAHPDPEQVRAALANLPTLDQLYVSMLQEAATSFAIVARTLATPAEPAHPGVLVHCTAGKDRTGVACALLLDAAGVERSAVVADYTASGRNLAGVWADGMRARLSAAGLPLLPALEELVTATPASAIESALEWIDAHGGSAAYLESGGLTPDEIDRVRARLTA